MSNGGFNQCSSYGLDALGAGDKKPISGASEMGLQNLSSLFDCCAYARSNARLLNGPLLMRVATTNGRDAHAASCGRVSLVTRHLIKRKLIGYRYATPSLALTAAMITQTMSKM